jgi:hypothetical protein
MDLLFDIHVLVLVLGGILAVSALIVAQKPNARQMIEKIAPYQTLIGLGLIGLGIVNFFRMVPHLTDAFKVNLLLAAVELTICGASILLGALFGMGTILKFLAGNAAAEQKAHDLVMKVAPYQVLIGLAGLAASLFYFLYRFKILTMSM